MRIQFPLVVVACCLAACTVEAPPEESEPIAPAVEEEQEAEKGYRLRPIDLEPPISDAIIPGAPAWAVESWTRLPEGFPAPTLQGLLGKVVVILCFQHW